MADNELYTGSGQELKQLWEDFPQVDLPKVQWKVQDAPVEADTSMEADILSGEGPPVSTGQSALS